MGIPRRFTISEIETYFSEQVMAWLRRHDKNNVPGEANVKDPYMIGAQFAVIVFAFAGQTMPQIAAAATVALGTLMLRDRWIHPATGEPLEVWTDVAAMGAAVIMSQVYFHVYAPVFQTYYLSDLLHGTGWSMIGVAGVRLLFHGNTPNNDPAFTPEGKVVRGTWRITLTGIFAVWMLCVSNAQAVPIGHLLSAVLGMMTLVSFRAIVRFQTGERWTFLEPLLGRGFLAQAEAFKKTITASTDALPMPPSKERPKTKEEYAAQAIFVLCMMSTTLIAVWRHFFGSTAGIRWYILLSNIAGMIIMIPVWRLITYLNKSTKDAIRQALDKNNFQNG